MTKVGDEEGIDKDERFELKIQIHRHKTVTMFNRS